MSSANLLVRVQSKSETTLVFETAETGNGSFVGARGFFTPSFALLVAYDGGTLGRHLYNADFSEPQWWRDNLAKYVVSYERIREHNLISSQEGALALCGQLEGLAYEDYCETLLRLAPRVECRAVFTEPRWLDGLKDGDIFETTAYDAYSAAPDDKISSPESPNAAQRFADHLIEAKVAWFATNCDDTFWQEFDRRLAKSPRTTYKWLFERAELEDTTLSQQEFEQFLRMWGFLG